MVLIAPSGTASAQQNPINPRSFTTSLHTPGEQSWEKQKPEQTKYTHDGQLETALMLPTNFAFAAVDSVRGVRAARRSAAESKPPLGPLKNFTGTFTGTGFNTISGRKALLHLPTCASPFPATMFSSST